MLNSDYNKKKKMEEIKSIEDELRINYINIIKYKTTCRTKLANDPKKDKKLEILVSAEQELR